MQPFKDSCLLSSLAVLEKEESIMLYKDFEKAKSSDVLLSEIDFSDVAKEYKWKRGGVVWAYKYIECDISPTPYHIVHSSLLKLIEKKQENPVYFLSPNAAEGILRRVDGQNRTLFHPLRTALESLSLRNI
jgi:DNA (cytosine-5)-methyltransferase 1